MSSPPLRAKLVFWLLLGLFSAAFAEVPSGSAPFVLFTPWGLLVTLAVGGSTLAWILRGLRRERRAMRAGSPRRGLR